MLAEPEISEIGSLFLFLDEKYLVGKKKWLLSAIQVHICQHYNWYVKNRKSYMPECFYSESFFGICSRLLKIYWPDYTSCSPWEVNFFKSANILVSSKYKNILLLQDVIFILDILKYFDILSLLPAEVLCSFCIITWSRLSGNTMNFHIFLMFDKIYIWRGHERWKIVTVKMSLMCSWSQYPGMLIKLTEA